MKKIIVFIVCFVLFAMHSQAQIKRVIVEKYYVSDTLDATDSTNFIADPTYPTPILQDSSITYRVYVQLDSGARIKKIYGTSNHPLRITSTANFYNNIDRPSAYFGYQLNKSWFSGNPTLGLDSWLTLGMCTKAHTGVLKKDDPDGSLIGGTHNGGGTAGITGGILINADTAAGIPIDTADGMVPRTGTYTTWIHNGLVDPITTVDTTVFGSTNVGKQFYSTYAYLQQNSGANGDSLFGNKVLVAQLTTKGTISFELNLEVVDSNGVSTNFVPSNNNLPTTGDTLVNGVLKYPPDPPVCGCKDPNYLEYNANYVCSNQDSCIHKIIFGCMDTLACNYDPNANYHIASLCCYPGKCNDRDITLVCPSISGDGGLQLFPNPATEQINLQFSSGVNNATSYFIYDAFGTVRYSKDLGMRSGSITENINITDLYPGIYMIKVVIGNLTESKTFMKQ